MRLIASAVLIASVNLSAGQQTLPPPYPRTGVTGLLDNERVKVWDVSWPKGAPSPLHRHLYDMTGVYYHPGDRVITEVDGSKRAITTNAGRIQWQLKGVTHVEEGTSDVSVRAVMIELKGDGPSGKVNTASQVAAFKGSATPLLDNARVTVWDYARPTVPASPHRHAMDTVVVWTEATKGHVVFMPAGTVHTEEPIDSASKATIFELK